MVRIEEKGMRFAERSPDFMDSGFDHITPIHSERLLKGEQMHNENKTGHA